ncbi:N-acetyltransferase [Enterococcus sp. BWB1-3]|uniref:N-acetyltransferase n=1 Tax=unclassified Enterococcus TaxID=2608891 RepID=UPI001923BE9D|nr:MULTISPECIES: N-acetyltransferase [unclassified Enterococcus]MBL1228596.1 N-acetyltransferase [Enterococcus sp. BWB1-3]MCB5950602.1 N-acetyltransferase [Enterococcus sp. BWT-B8]MCB5955926.1 N-acetyltransferase [Enterococcus sp. CWB-B31]
MLIPYRKEHQKIAAGLLSFHDKMEKYHSLLNEIEIYEQSNNLSLLLWIPTQEKNIQGLLGIEQESARMLVLHDISINPSLRGEGAGFLLLNELQENYSDCMISGTNATVAYLDKWKQKQGN